MADGAGLRVDIEPRGVIEIRPGETLTLFLDVYNSTSIIDGFTVTLIGVDREWVASDPELISLFPEKGGNAVLTVELPTDFPAGRHKLGVKVASKTNAEVAWVSDIELSVAPVRSAAMRVEPDSVTAGRTARFGVTLENTGNVPVDLALQAADQENRLTAVLQPSRVDLPSRGVELSQLTLQGRRPMTGAPAVRSVKVTARGPEVSLESTVTFIQKPLIPRALLTIAGVLGMMALWGLILGQALDLIVDDVNQDVAASIEEGMGNVADALTAEREAADQGAAGGGGGAPQVPSEPALAMMTGTVTTASTGEPLPGAAVSAIPLDPSGAIDTEREPVTTTTGDDGTYVLDDLTVGLWKLRVVAVGYEVAWFPDAPTPAEAEPAPIPSDGNPRDVVLVGVPDDITGTVADADGEPLDGVRVTTEGGPGAATTVTEGGRFTLAGLPTPGVYVVTFAKPRFADEVRTIELEPGSTLEPLEVALLPGFAQLRGTVTMAAPVEGAEATPLGGVKVEVSGEDGTVLVTESLTEASGNRGIGSYVLNRVPVPGEYTVTFSKDGFVESVAPISFEPGIDPGPLDATLTAAEGLLQGTVTFGPDRTPLGGVTVTVTGADNAVFTAATLTGPDASSGTYTVPDLPTPASYTVTFTTDGLIPVVLPVEIGPGATATLNASLGGGALVGIVRDTQGEPLGGVTVTVSGAGLELSAATATAGQIGVYEAGGIELAGTYTLSFAKPGYLTQTALADVKPPETVTVDVVLSGEPGAIAGTVLGPAASPVGGFAVEPLPGVSVSTASPSMTTTSAADGSFLLNGLPTPASYSLGFSRAGYVSVTRSVALEPGREVSGIEATLPLAGTITGTVTLNQEEVVTNAIIELEGVEPAIPGISVDVGIRRRHSNGAGVFTFNGLPTPGTFRITVRPNPEEGQTFDDCPFTVSPFLGGIDDPQLFLDVTSCS